MKNLLKIFVFACVLFLAIGQTGLDAKNEGDTIAELALTQTYSAQAALDPAALSGASVTVTTYFKGLGGFATAELIAEITTSGTVLQVTLYGYTGSELPEGVTLADILVSDANGDRSFVVAVDGGLIIVTEDLL